MTQPLTTGEKNRRANIRSLKAIGVKNAKIRAADKAKRQVAHEERNAAVARQAAHARAQRIANHERNNRHHAENAAWQRDAKKKAELRAAAGIPSIAQMLADNDAGTVADMLLSGLYGELPMAA